MTAKNIFFKTLSFGWVKLLLGLINILVAVLLFALLMGLALLFKSEGTTAVMFIIWLVLIGIVNFIVNHYFGYLIKAGHVAVISQAFRTGTIPESPISAGIAMVKEHFGTSNVYFALDKLVAGAVKQLQNALGRLGGGLIGTLPGGNGVMNLVKMFLNISLGYIDECCLGYTFSHPNQNPYKSAADGVVIYAQNWKVLLKDAAKTTGIVILSFVAVTLVSFLIFGGLFSLFGWSGFIAFVISLLLAYTVKYAFIDSWILVKMMSSYMQVVPTTQITFDLYGKLSALSGKFKELFQRGGEKEPKPAYCAEQPAAAPTILTKTSSVPVVEVNADNRPRFCSSCGASQTTDMKFCWNCGGQIR